MIMSEMLRQKHNLPHVVRIVRDLPADRWLRYPQPCRCSVEIPLFRDRDEIFQMAQFHSEGLADSSTTRNNKTWAIDPILVSR